LTVGCDEQCQQERYCQTHPIECGREPQNNLALMEMAEGIVWDQYPDAVLIEVHGSPSGGSATTAEEIDRWGFVFVEDANSPVTGTITLQFADGAFGQPVYLSQPWGGTVYERLPQVVTAAEALATVRAAGYTAPLEEVVIRKPLTCPFPEEAYYAFLIEGQYVLVGAESNTLIED